MFNVIILSSLLTETANAMAAKKPEPGVLWDEEGVADGVKDVRNLIIKLVDAGDRVSQIVVWNQAITEARIMSEERYENTHNQMRARFFSGIILAVESVLNYGGVIGAVTPPKYHFTEGRLGYALPVHNSQSDWGTIPELLGGDHDGDEVVMFKPDGIIKLD